jgi:predicted nucleotidyltransferase
MQIARRNTGMLSIDEIKTVVIPLVEIYPINRVILFGSYARGDATENSDVDLLIDSEDQLNGFDFFGISGRIIKKMPIKVDIFEMSEVIKPSPLYEKIVKEGVIIYEAGYTSTT